MDSSIAALFMPAGVSVASLISTDVFERFLRGKPPRRLDAGLALSGDMWEFVGYCGEPQTGLPITGNICARADGDDR